MIEQWHFPNEQMPLLVMLCSLRNVRYVMLASLIEYSVIYKSHKSNDLLSVSTRASLSVASPDAVN